MGPCYSEKICRSTGIEDDGSEASKHKAESIVLDLLNDSSFLSAGNDVYFEDLAGEFWNWETSKYTKDRLARDKKAFGPEYCYNNWKIITKHVLPIMGKMRFNDITPDFLDGYVTYLLNDQKLSSQTVKHVLHAMGPIFDQAKSKYFYIKTNPMKLMMPSPVRSKIRDAFTPKESAKLLNPKNFNIIWTIDKKFSPDYDPWIYYSISLLIAVTGARFSAVTPLTREDIKLVVNGPMVFYEVSMLKSVSPIQGIKEGSKTGKGHVVPVAPEIMSLILPHLPQKGLLFPSDSATGVITHRSAQRALIIAMGKAGISKEEQSKRLLGFHSWRHAFVTKARASGIPDTIIQGFTEHKSKEMDDAYTHYRASDLLAALPIQRAVLEG